MLSRVQTVGSEYLLLFIIRYCLVDILLPLVTCLLPVISIYQNDYDKHPKSDQF